MKQIFLVFSAILLMSLIPPSAYCQSDIPGSSDVKSVFGITQIETDDDLELCCFAAYGWHLVDELKFDAEISEFPFEDISIVERLLKFGLRPIDTEQYYQLEDGRIVVILSRSNFEKILDRFIRNVNLTKEKK
ncbi:MAG: hypothetical protein COA49_02165 [Bacteroidetes bacterium]|nr:MAG: hypothetical protein COA49_02165 [Bacteroidota bacterium]